MSATTFAAIAAFEVEFFGETFVAFGCKVEIFAFDWYIFFILVEHRHTPKGSYLFFKNK
jgi:hypothetical protein